MFSEDKVTEIFCLADEFCKFFDAQQEKSMAHTNEEGARRNGRFIANKVRSLIHVH